jgi:hypothetical protein
MLKEKELKSLLVIVLGLVVLFLFTNNWYLLYAGLAIGGLGMSIPVVGYYIVWFWFKIAEVLGWVNSKIILGLVFYLFLTPLSLLYRLGKKDPMTLKAPETSNYEKREHIFKTKDLENTW